MSGSLNKVTLLGNVGKDPEVRRLNSGSMVVNLSLATSESWKDKQSGEKRERTEWHRIVIFNENLGKIVEQYVKKGSKIYVEGQLQTRKWTDKDGVEKYATEVVIQGFGGQIILCGGTGAGNGGASSGGGQSAGQSASRGAPARSEMDDEIPF